MSTTNSSTAFTLATNLTLYSPQCPWGLAGTGCQRASCNTTLVPSSQRVARPANERCTTCPDGWGGNVNCNICQRADACQVAQRGVGFTPPSTNTSAAAATSLVPQRDSTAVCVNTPRAITANALQCDMNQTTLASIFGGSFQLTAVKTVAMEGITPSDFDTVGVADYNAPAGTYTSQIWLDGVMQWGCQASSCSSLNSTDPADRPAGASSTSVTDLWKCSNLKCACVPGSTVCGGGAFDLSSVIENLSGDTVFACAYPADQSAASRGDMRCRFTGPAFASALGPEGLPLVNCQAGACITKSDLTNYWAEDNGVLVVAKASQLSAGVIAGLAVLGAFLLALLLAVLAGLLLRAKARKAPREPPTPAVGLRWVALDYVIPAGLAGGLLGKLGKKGKRSSAKPAKAESSSGGSIADPEKHADGTASSGKAAATTPNIVEHEHHQLLSVPIGRIDASKATADLDESRNGGHILRDVSGEVAPGSMLAILGPSGAGKTSLVDILAGRAKTGTTSGTVSLLSAATFQGVQQQRKVAFVDQEDVLPPFSTVREALEMAAQLSLPENVPRTSAARS